MISRDALIKKLPRPTAGEAYLLLVPVLAAIAALGGTSLQIGGLSYTGFLWVAALLAGFVLLGIEKALRPQNPVCFPFGPWMIWMLWMVMSFSWLDTMSYQHVQDAAQVLMPILVGVLASMFITTRARLEQLVRMYFYSIPLLALMTSLWVAGVSSETDAPVMVTIRALALTSVVIGALGLAGVNRSFTRGWSIWIICMGLTVVTGARMATLAMLMLPVLNPVRRNLFRKVVVIACVFVVGTCVYLSSTFQERFFRGEGGGIDQIAAGDFDTAGRFDSWPTIFEEALERPWLGHGEGSVRILMLSVWEDSAHPHNDYLRVGYELGSIGLVIYLGVLAWQLWNLRGWIRRTDGVVQQAFAAAWMSLFVFLFIAFTDNPIIYNLYYMNPIFALMGAAYKVAHEESRAVDPYHAWSRPASLGYRPWRPPALGGSR